MRLKYILLICLFSVMCTWQLLSEELFTLTIEISGLRNSKGKILIEFNNAEGERLLAIQQKISDGKCIVIIPNLKQGKYSFKYFHDENNNEEMDTNWIGIPKEGYGFSNNAKGLFGPPSHKKTVFSIEKNTTMKCQPEYI